MKRTATLLAFALAASLGAYSGPTSPEACARQLGISYSAEDGATERLDAFQLCAGGITNA